MTEMPVWPHCKNCNGLATYQPIGPHTAVVCAKCGVLVPDQVEMKKIEIPTQPKGT